MPFLSPLLPLIKMDISPPLLWGQRKGHRMLLSDPTPRLLYTELKRPSSPTLGQMETQARNLCQAQGSLTKQQSCFAQVINRPKKGCGAIYEGHGQERFIRVWPSDSLSGSRAAPVWLRISAASHFLIDSLALQSATPSTQRVLFKSGCPSPGWRAAWHTGARTPPVAAWDS